MLRNDLGNYYHFMHNVMRFCKIFICEMCWGEFSFKTPNVRLAFVKPTELNPVCCGIHLESVWFQMFCHAKQLNAHTCNYITWNLPVCSGYTWARSTWEGIGGCSRGGRGRSNLSPHHTRASPAEEWIDSCEPNTSSDHNHSSVLAKSMRRRSDYVSNVNVLWLMYVLIQ